MWYPVNCRHSRIKCAQHSLLPSSLPLRCQSASVVQGLHKITQRCYHPTSFKIMQITKVTALSWILDQLKFPFNHWSDNLSQIHHTDANGAKVMERMKIINYILLINKSILGGFWILTLHFIGARNSGREAGCRCLGCLENPLGEQPIGTNHLYALPISAIIIRIMRMMISMITRKRRISKRIVTRKEPSTRTPF